MAVISVQRYMPSTTITQLAQNIRYLIANKLLNTLECKKFSPLAIESTHLTNRTQQSNFAHWKWKQNGSIWDHYLGFVNVKKITAEYCQAVIQGMALANCIQLLDLKVLGLMIALAWVSRSRTYREECVMFPLMRFMLKSLLSSYSKGQTVFYPDHYLMSQLNLLNIICVSIYNITLIFLHRKTWKNFLVFSYRSESNKSRTRN